MSPTSLASLCGAFCLLAFAPLAGAQCPGPGCPKNDPPAAAAAAVVPVADKGGDCPGAGCPRTDKAAAKKKSAANKAKPKEAKQDWGHFSSGAKKDQKAMEKQKAKKGGESSGG
jgi:hypothetical protein